MNTRLHPSEEMVRGWEIPIGRMEVTWRSVCRVLASCIDLQGENRFLCGLLGQTWVWVWMLVPNQCPKGGVVGSHLPSLLNSIRLGRDR